MTTRTRHILTDTITILFIALFLYTAISKIKMHRTFIEALDGSFLLQKFATSLSYIIPAVELIITSLLVFPATRKPGLLYSTILIFLFTGYIAYMLLSGTELPCQCGGIIAEMTWKQHLLFNSVFTILGFIGWKLYKKTTNDRQSQGS